VTRPDLSVETRRTASEAVVILVGEIDISTAGKLDRAIEQVSRPEPPARVLLDLGGVTFCDSHGISLLVLASKRLARGGNELVLVNVRESLLRVLDITGLRDAFHIHRACRDMASNRDLRSARRAEA
jgi:anti-anti-sigma factor